MAQPPVSLASVSWEDFCRRWKITELALFGSAARDELTPESDIDLLARFAPDAEWTLLDHVRMQDELEALLERPVDLVSRRAVEADRNYVRRSAILGTVRTLYAA
jgi:uncharacterized protein